MNVIIFDHIVCMCFLHQPTLIGVGVDFDCVEMVAGMLGCTAIRIPFVYLGVHVGGNMNRVASWNFLLDKFQKRLSLGRLDFCLLEVGLR